MSNGLKGLVVLAALVLPGRMYAMEATATKSAVTTLGHVATAGLPAVPAPVPCDAAALDGGCAEKAITFLAATYVAGKATAAFAGLTAACAEGLVPACFGATGAGAVAVKAGLEAVRAGKALAECDDEE